MNLEAMHLKLQQWAITAAEEDLLDLSASLWTAAECVADTLHLDDEDEAE